MDLGMRHRETRSMRRMLRYIERAPEAQRAPIIIGDAGTGKTTGLMRACRETQWPVTIAQAFRGLLDKNRTADIDDLLQLVRDCGLETSDRVRDAEGWFTRKIISFDETLGSRSIRLYRDFNPSYRVRLVKVDRGVAAEWVQEYAKDTKQALDPLKPQLLTGHFKDSVPAPRLYRRSRVMDTANLVLTDLATEFLGGRTPHGLSQRRRILEHAWIGLGAVVIFDDAHVWGPQVLSWLPELVDIGARFVLAGTPALLATIRRNPRLKPLETRLGPVLELRPPTLEEISEAFPGLPRGVVIRAWTRAGRNLRVLGSIVAELERAVAAAPGRRASVGLVDDIADLLVAARPAAACDVAGGEDEGQEVEVAAKASGRPAVPPALKIAG